MKYDDVTWHLGDDYPAGLPPEAGATMAGMFLAWALLSGRASEAHLDAYPAALTGLAARVTTPGAYFLDLLDGSFTDAELDDTGNAFAADYFDYDVGQYVDDYEATFGHALPNVPNALYFVGDTWANFDLLQPVLDRRFAEWQARPASVRKNP